ncbi:MAG: hypothetical protein GEU82_05170 [Luteitalea sp.]|nr:hypothetical protein [Luteitalea sp.]
MFAVAIAVGCNDNPVDPSRGTTMSMFVSSARSTTGNLGGLRGADATCQNLAGAVGMGNKIWRAYLSVESDADNNGRPTDARSRIGQGPWYNADLVLVARDLTELHARAGDADLFLDERSQRIAGQWPNSPRPVEHDILTGSTAQGTLMPGLTCRDWTSSAPDVAAQVGHSDGLGPNADPSGALSSWNSSHANQNCANTAPRGGAGRIYCFATN